ncbi:MAG: response regulator transcription factor [Dysosmobacter sp.]|jgi:two-component system OmpR family response regulator|nr:response regulator transcription factor [Oscillospiraceae bacterium]MCI9290116.1 response regulator transcription factor [Oscillospiraceae bacterium]MCX4372327.1 response regulator transcription factor [Dysosmobacter sp.]
MFQILVVEDDNELRDLFCAVLTENGYTAVPAVDGIDAFDILDETYVDLIISDIMMPRMDGFELIKALREAHYNTPVLMITARSSAADKREGFRIGTDDYMVKPIDVNEMVWRVEALLRRSQIASQRRTKLGDTILDCDTLTVHTGGEETELPQKEFLLLFKLAASPNHIFTRRQLMDDIWGVDSETDPHTLDVHISRLRERFRGNPDFDIITIRGLGYKVVKK